MPQILPIITIQPDFQSTISDVQNGRVESENIWLSAYLTEKPSVHAQVRVHLDEVDRNLVRFSTTDSVNVTVNNGLKSGDPNATYSVACSSLNIQTMRVILPKREYSDPERPNVQVLPQKIISFDISPDGKQYTTGFHDGTVHIYNTSSTSTSKQLSKVHLSTVTCLQFFPSSRVLLTAGADFSLQILPAEPTSETCVVSSVRSLKGHTRAITSTAIISKGRNILSSAADGTLRLWDVSKGEQIRLFTAGQGTFVAMNAISVGLRPSSSTVEDPQLDPREVDTSDKVVFCALQDGSFEVFDLGSKRSVHRSDKSSAPLTSISYSDEHGLIATGSSNGVVKVYDVNALATPILEFSRNGASVEDLVFADTKRFSPDHPVGLVVVTEDGLPYIASVHRDSPGVVGELVGVDCDAVRVVRVGVEGQIWIASDDGIVRRY